MFMNWNERMILMDNSSRKYDLRPSIHAIVKLVSRARQARAE